MQVNNPVTVSTTAETMKFTENYGVNPNNTYGTGLYSPVTLSRDWPATTRLLVMFLTSVYGTIMNGFFVASFITEKTLIRVGLMFLTGVGIADLIVSTVVIPISTVVLLSGQWDNVNICKVIALATEFAAYNYSLSFLLVAVENYYRICKPIVVYERLVKIGLGIVSAGIFTISFLFASIGIYYDLDNDYCERKHYGHFNYRLATTLILHVIPGIFTLLLLVLSARRVSSYSRKDARYRRKMQSKHDSTMTKINIFAFLLYVLSWSPYLIVTFMIPKSSDTVYYFCTWIGVARFNFTSIFYAIVDQRIRKAFGNLFKYFFCKSALPDSPRYRCTRRRRRNRVRRHMLQQIAKNQRDTSPSSDPTYL